ncbi:hypothetical protein [Nitrosospira sp. NRS527]|uniref:hypothetical protein n=1 Tax=Nitrosospira sp. NRS527 TaxID=155925 RepID=UPI001BD12A55|nr:hypothetical protein [Nitrosospira sp. NRS527]
MECAKGGDVNGATAQGGATPSSGRRDARAGYRRHKRDRDIPGAAGSPLRAISQATLQGISPRQSGLPAKPPSLPSTGK